MTNIFSIDNTINYNNKLPFIRIGRYPFSSSIINDALGENINKFDLPLDMANAIWWINKHLDNFGNCDYIGICHYRRFFSHIIQQGILPLIDDNVNINLIANRDIQENICKTNNLDGIITFPWYEDFFKNPNSKGYGQISDYKYCWEGTYYQFKTDNVGLTLEQCKLAYDNLLLCSPDYLKQCIINAFEIKTVHFCSIFTLKYDLFKDYCNIVLKALFKTIIEINPDDLKNSNCRVGGYLLERLGSTFFWALKLYKKKLISLPIIELNSNIKPIYRNQTVKDCNMKFKINEFKIFYEKEYK